MLARNPLARLLTLAALKQGKDPLKSLGVPAALHDQPQLAALVGQLSHPRHDPAEQEDLDEQILRAQERMDLEDAWRAATETGYDGPRGQHQPAVRRSTPPKTT